MYKKLFSEFLSLKGDVADEFMNIRHIYALTVVPNKKDKVYDETDISRSLSDLMYHFKKFSLSEFGSYEIKKSSNILHWHGMLLSPTLVYKKLFNKYIKNSLPGWSINIKELLTEFDYRRWKKYILKERRWKSQLCILTEHKCLNYNLFTDDNATDP